MFITYFITDLKILKSLELKNLKFYKYYRDLIDELPEYIAENCMIRIGERTIPVGIEGMKQHMLEVRKTYPDLKMTIIRQYIDGDTVISEFIMEGTHMGEWLEMKPLEKSFG